MARSGYDESNSPAAMRLPIVEQVLQQMLLGHGLGPGDQHRALGRFGAGSLQEDVQALAAKLTDIAAVTEAVYEGVYSKLASGLLL